MTFQGDAVSMAAPCIGSLLALVALLFALRAGRRKRLVDNIPTSKTTGVFIGLVELKGTAEAETPLRSVLAEVPCVFYRWSVEERWSRTVTETTTDSQGHTSTRTRTKSGWTTVASGEDATPFYLKDDRGVILVRPEGADLRGDTVFDRTCGDGDPLYYAKGPASAVANSDHRRRFVEGAIPLHAGLYIMGQARERSDIVAAEIARDPNAPMYLITTQPEERVSRGLRLAFWGLSALGLVLAAAGVFIRTARQGVLPAQAAPAWLAAGGIYLGAWFLGWLWTAYNGMVELRQRVRQAWANVDVQLKRRNDLIPKLVEVAAGLRDYERRVQTEVTHLRTQLTATPPGEPGPDPHACGQAIAAIVERYPELKANDAFLALQKTLIDTEDRIGLARAYFNDIATFYNTRLETIPDRYVAALGRMKPRAVMAADNFEREPIRVELAA